MKTKVFAGLLALVVTGLVISSANAQEIPAGYAIVPISSLATQSALPVAAPTVIVSPTNSALRASDDVGFVGSNDLLITATLRDTAGRPLAGRVISLVSSRATDSVNIRQTTTDANGEAVFGIMARQEGISSLTAIDQASGVTIAERPRIVFLEKAGGLGGNLLRSEVLADTSDSPLSFTGQIEVNFPTVATINTPLDITVDITDIDGNVVETSADTISFTSPDFDIILPTDYDFKEVDRGVHIFANAVTFPTSGLKTITIFSVDPNIKPVKLTIDVRDEGFVDPAPLIKSPVNDALIGGVVQLEGSAAPNSNLVVLVGDQMLAETESGEFGDFSIDLELRDGAHQLFVARLNIDNSIGVTSDPVDIVVDTTPPELVNISFDPDNEVVAGAVVKVMVKSESALLEAVLIVDDKELVLSEETRGVYVGQLETSTPGVYSLGVELTDPANNTAHLSNVAALRVKENLATIEAQATPKSGRVNLQWEPPSNHAEIDHYIIFYGLGADSLNQRFVTFDNRTAWYIDKLNNNTTYYFQVVSLDAAGDTNGRSEIMEAAPINLLNLDATGCNRKILLGWAPPADQSVASWRVDYGIASGDYSEQRVLPGDSDRAEWEVRDLINGIEYFLTVRGLATDGSIVFAPDEETRATPTEASCHSAASDLPVQLWQREDDNGNLLLTWTSAPGAISYRVYAGTRPNFFDLPVVTATTTYLRPEGLLANENYYFAVRAVYANGESERFSNALKVEVGPALIALVALTTALVGGWLMRRRKLSRQL